MRASILGLAERFRPDDARGLDATFVVEIEGHPAYTIHVRAGRCLVSVGDTGRCESRLRMDARTWLDLVAGRADGIAAFMAGRVSIQGDLNLAVRLETLFRPGPETTRLLRTVETEVSGTRLESFVAGSGAPIVLLHGLAANKVSFLPTFDGLAGDYEVHALDLPGFGRSGKPLPAGRRYSPAWMADMVRGYLLRNRIRDAHVVGNSMGGRIATELALRHPRLVRGMVALGAAVAFDEWQRLGRVLRVTQPHWLASVRVPLRRSWVESGMRELFHDPTCIPPDNLRAGVDEALAMSRDPRYRLAVAACARHLAAERSSGRRGFWTRLAGMQVPSLWVWGSSDRLSSHRYGERVARALPDAEIQLWDDVGHVPQFEVPERTTDAVRDFIARVDRLH